jgi:hypothetical protein
MNMYTKLTGRIRSLAATVAVILPMMLVSAIVSAGPASAAALTNPVWAVSNNATSATGVTYTWQFTTATTLTISSVTMSSPATTLNGSPAVVNVFGLGASTVGFASNVTTLTVTTPVSVPAGTAIYIEVSGYTNTATVGSATSTITTNPGAVDTAVTPAITLGNNLTTVSVVVDKSLTFTNDTASWQFLMDAGVPNLAIQNKNVTLTIKTNAKSGYTLSVHDLGLTQAGAPNIAKATAGMNSATASPTLIPPDSVGYHEVITASGGGSGIALSAGTTGLSTQSGYVGYTTAGETPFTATAGTGAAADTIVLGNRVSITYVTMAGTYIDTITYTATPSY